LEKHNAPTFRANSFDCPHCGVYSYQQWEDFSSIPMISSFLIGIEVARCAHCKRHSVWDQETLVYPIASIAPQPSPDMPEDVAADFNEAREVLAFSPRSSAALLRLALEKLCAHLEMPGKNLNERIGAMVQEGLSPKIQKALDIVRVIGNNAVHPGSIDLKDDQQAALVLFELINVIVEQMITIPRMIDETYATLPEEILEQIGKRNAAKTQQ
jgi:hypothetical protein